VVVVVMVVVVVVVVVMVVVVMAVVLLNLRVFVWQIGMDSEYILCLPKSFTLFFFLSFLTFLCVFFVCVCVCVCVFSSLFSHFVCVFCLSFADTRMRPRQNGVVVGRWGARRFFAFSIPYN
jgi:hypothetical protein